MLSMKEIPADIQTFLAQQDYQAFFDLLAEGVVIGDIHGTMVYANASAAAILGMTPDALLACGFDNAVWRATTPAQDTLTDHDALYARVLRDGQSVHGVEVGFTRPDGQRATIAVSNAPLTDRYGVVHGVIFVFTDVTARLQTEMALRKSEKTARALMDAPPEGMLLLDRSYRILALNDPAAQRFNVTREGAIGMDALALQRPEVVDTRRMRLDEVIRTGQPAQFEDQREGRWFLSSIYPIFDQLGEVDRLAIYSREITGRKRAIERLQADARKQAAIAELGQRALRGMRLSDLMADALRTLIDVLQVDCCEVLELMTGGEMLRAIAGVGWPEDLLAQATFPTDAGQWPGHTLASGGPCAIAPDNPDGIILPALLQQCGMAYGAMVVISGRGESYGLLGVHTTAPRSFSDGDLTFLRNIANVLGAAIERNFYEEELRYLSTHDALTKLYNRAFFEEEFERLERGRRYPVSIVVIDVDGLKVANDTLGHQVGDALLCRTAAVLLATFRAEDMVARIGGDEFAILLPHVDEVSAVVILNRLQQQIEADNHRHGAPKLQLSVGLSTAAVRDVMDEIFRKADMEMYRDKMSRRSSPMPVALDAQV